ncbi:hypothetical protein EQV77_11865 [Halobacillus fulvus]|nr:hypothetical protein EQV77_11865 [Halobacillus fulvus]
MIFNDYWKAAAIVFPILFLTPILGAKLMDFLDEKFLYRIPKRYKIWGIILLTIGVEAILTYVTAKNTGWPFLDAQFSIGFLVLILLVFMQMNEHTGKQYANVDNRVYGDGKETYAVSVFRLEVNPVALGAIIYFAVGVILSLIVYL